MSAAPFSAFSPRHLNVATCRHAANHAGPTQHTDGRSLRVRHDQDAQYSVVATERLGSHRRCFCLALPKQHRNRATLTSRRGYARPRRVNVKLLPQGESCQRSDAAAGQPDSKPSEGHSVVATALGVAASRPSSSGGPRARYSLPAACSCRPRADPRLLRRPQSPSAGNGRGRPALRALRTCARSA